jgi:disulfide bond formation protein DsbB
MRLPALLTRTPWPVAAALVSAAMLATAHGFQHLGGFEPCALCLRQREIFWGAIAIALAGLVLARYGRLPIRVVSLLLAAIFLTGAVVAGFHAGAEWKWWPGPATCAGLLGGGIDAADLTGLLDGTTKVRPPACDEASWRMMGLSMAGWNVLVSAALAAISLMAAVGPRRPG